MMLWVELVTKSNLKHQGFFIPTQAQNYNYRIQVKTVKNFKVVVQLILYAMVKIKHTQYLLKKKEHRSHEFTYSSNNTNKNKR